MEKYVRNEMIYSLLWLTVINYLWDGLQTIFMHHLQKTMVTNHHFEGLVQDCSNSIANALELLQSCTKPLYWCVIK